MDMETKDRIKEALKFKKMTQVELAEKTGYSVVYISEILRGVKGGESTKVGVLENIAKALNVSMGYLFGEVELDNISKSEIIPPDLKIYYGEQPPEDIDDTLIAVPLYNTKAAATPDVIDLATDEVSRWVTYRNVKHYQPSSLHGFQVRGDSMFPDLHNNEYVIVQKNGFEPPLDPSNKDIYLCQYVDEIGQIGLLVKRVQKVGDMLALVSRNSDYPPRFVNLKEVDYQVIVGRVVFSWREW